MILNEWIEADIKTCIRCNGNHSDLRFNVVKNYASFPCNEFFALCPETNQPLTISINDNGIGEDYVGLTKVPTRPNL